jgi:hypothetical protein
VDATSLLSTKVIKVKKQKKRLAGWTAGNFLHYPRPRHTKILIDLVSFPRIGLVDGGNLIKKMSWNDVRGFLEVVCNLGELEIDLL